MLSYRHSFHAGNFADVLKHIVLVEILEHLTKKETPFDYVDTHSGAGLFDLTAGDSQKLQEYTAGIARLKPEDFPELESFFDVVHSVNHPDTLDFYPGSPFFAQHFLREQDRSWLYELHPRDFEFLSENMGPARKTRVHHQDGFEGLNAVLPPASRRGLVLIDPSYEVKSDYDLVIDEIARAHRKFAHGVYALWYPVVDRQRIDDLEYNLAQTGIKNIQRFELGIRPDTDERGMTSSGMIVINPPWKMIEKMAKLLPKLSTMLGEGNESIFKCDVLADE